MEGLRALAILLVFLVHYHALFADFAPSGSLTYRLAVFGSSIGHVGVDLFFVISGYLIYGALLRKKIRMADFLRRRVRRIYPTFVCVFAIYVVCMLAIPSIAKVSWGAPGFARYLLENFFLLPGMFPIVPMISVAWSLSYEFFFYITVPMLVAAFGMRAWERRWRVTFFVVLAAAYATLAGVGVIGHVRLLMFIAGMLLYESLESRIFEGHLGSAGETGAIVAFCFGLLLAFRLGLLPAGLAASDPSSGSPLPGPASWLPVYRLMILSPAIFAFTLYTIRFDGVLGHLFSLPPMRWLGNISYSYFLVHGVSLHVLRAFVQWSRPASAESSTLLFWVFLPLGILVTIIVSAVLFLLVEKPFSFPNPRSSSRREESGAIPSWRSFAWPRSWRIYRSGSGNMAEHLASGQVLAGRTEIGAVLGNKSESARNAD